MPLLHIIKIWQKDYINNVEWLSQTVDRVLNIYTRLRHCETEIKTRLNGIFWEKHFFQKTTANPKYIFSLTGDIYWNVWDKFPDFRFKLFQKSTFLQKFEKEIFKILEKTEFFVFSIKVLMTIKSIVILVKFFESKVGVWKLWGCGHKIHFLNFPKTYSNTSWKPMHF